MCSGKPSDVNHCAAKGRLDNTVSHANDEKQEEGEGVSSRVENSNDDEIDLAPHVGSSVVILEIYAKRLE